ncbi:MAG: SusF/SusE family outer membrane protein [Bacteroidales bacterium]|jgi:hypothetical protein|nr:SusF/SusE family outer membrane protein [Bacteroidales bacterium]
MKFLNTLLYGAVFALVVVACQKKEDKYVVATADLIKAPVLAEHEPIVATEDNLTDNVTFTWQPADYGVPAAPEYTLYAKINTSSDDGEDLIIASGYGKSIQIKMEDLNKRLTAAGAQPTVPVDVTFTLTASIGKGYGTVKSVTVTVNFTALQPRFPEHVYMIGDDFGNWQWDSPDVVELTPVNGREGCFWCVRHITAGRAFKWNSVKDWGGDFYTLGNDVGFTSHDDNAYADQTGMYIVFIDYAEDKIAVEPAQVYGIGDCFGGWNAGQYPFVADGNLMKLTATADGNLRIYANSTISGVGGDWWRMEFVIQNGKIEYRGNGGDQPSVPVTSGKTITLNFNTGTGTVE